MGVLSSQRRMMTIDGLQSVSMMHAGRLGVVGCTYFLRATFDADDQGYADAQVLDTVAEGVQDGQLTVVEKEGTLAIVGNKCAITPTPTGAWGDLGFYSQAITKGLGITLLCTVNKSSVGASKYGPLVGFDLDMTLTRNGLLLYYTQNGALFAWWPGPAYVQVGTMSASTDYESAVVLGGYDSNGVPWHDGAAGTYDYGATLFIKGGAFSAWTMLWRIDSDNTSTLYTANACSITTGTIDNFRVPNADLSAVLEPLVKDTFTDANGTSLDAHAPDVGGAWNERTGNFDIQTNRSNISASTGVRDVATIPATVADLFARTTIRKTVAADSGEFGHCLRWTDANNFWMVHGDLAANQIEIVERNGGVETQRGATAVALTHSTDYDIVVIADAQDITGVLNSTVRVAYAAAALNENVTLHGTVGNQAGQTFDDYHVHARTAAVYDTTLDLC